MALQIKKGEKLNITKAAQDAGNTNLAKLTAGAGWDPATEGAEIDLDLVAILIGSDGKAIGDKNGNGSNLDEAVCYFEQLDTIPGLKHSGDSLTGEGEGDDEQIVITLADIPAEAQKIAIVIASYSGEKFGDIANAFVRIEDDKGNELVRYDLSENYGGTKGVLMGEVSRNGDQWEFKAVGEAREGADFSAVIESFGVY
jgi:tellurium resistance protein TerD